MYQVFQKIENDIDNNADSGNALKLFEVYNETVFWVEVEANESITSKIKISIYETEGENRPFLNAYIADPDSEFPPEDIKKFKNNELTTFRKFTGFDIMFFRASSVPFDLMVIENEDEMFPITGEMFDAYATYIMNDNSSEHNDKVKAISAKSKLIEKGGPSIFIWLLLAVIFLLIVFSLFVL